MLPPFRTFRRFISTLVPATGALLALVLASGVARGQDGAAIEQFDPAPVGDPAFGVESPDVRGAATLRGMLLFDYARNPLVLTQSNNRVGAVVGNQLWLRLDGSFALFDRFLFSLDVPAALVQSGDNPSAGGLTGRSPSSAQFGDIRLGARARLLGPAGEGLHLALSAHVWLPTGARGAYVSDGTVRGEPLLVFGGNRDRLAWSAQGGVMLRAGQKLPGATATPLGDAITFGAGAFYLLGERRSVQLGPELYGQTTVAEGGTVFGKHSTTAELLADARWRPGGGPFVVGAGAGPGFGHGAGTPDFRVVAMFAYSPEKPRDRDGDGVPDDEDACPAVAGVPTGNPATNGCPAPPGDRDADGVPDKQDACPDVWGVRTSNPKTNGCPPDRDGDGVPDAKDACPDVKGIKTDDPKTNGCPPPDTDGDGIPDAQDACPKVKGVKTHDPKTNGCPPDADHDGVPDAVDACPHVPGVPQPNPKYNGCPRARLIRKENLIAITQQVQFETGKATIRPQSYGLLSDVAKVLKAHPEIELLQIQGHTDNKGPRYVNVKLSSDRAKSVRKWLIDHGIDKKRLVTHGYGPDRPIASNATAEGRARNRRVEFHVLRGPGSEAKPGRAHRRPAHRKPHKAGGKR